MTDIKDKINPYIWTAPEYNTAVLDKAWAHPELGRMMLNENPVPPSDAVVAAITDMAKKGNRYPDRAYRLREKLGKLHGLAADRAAQARGRRGLLTREIADEVAGALQDLEAAAWQDAALRRRLWPVVDAPPAPEVAP